MFLKWEGGVPDYAIDGVPLEGEPAEAEEERSRPINLIWSILARESAAPRTPWVGRMSLGARAYGISLFLLHT